MEKDVVGHKADQSYYSYTLFETNFRDAVEIEYQSYRFTMQLNISKAGEQGVLLFASDPEMIIADEGGAMLGASA